MIEVRLSGRWSCLALPNPAAYSAVLITPAGSAQAAIAYQIQKFQGALPARSGPAGR